MGFFEADVIIYGSSDDSDICRRCARCGDVLRVTLQDELQCF
jgi:hypothetical protein